MGFWGDVESAAGDVVHAGERTFDDVTGMLNSLHSFLTDAGPGDVVQELAQLADEASRLKQQLESAASSTKWTGAAASAFQQHARQRQQQVAELVQALDSAHTAVGAAYAIAGIC
jgi:uncharacterized protein YukE